MKRLFNSTARLAFYLAIAIALSGCAPSYNTVMREYKKSEICCRSVAEFGFQKLRMGELYSYIINNQSPAYQFHGDKSYFLAFELPKYEKPYHVLISSYAVMDPMTGGRYLFHPVVITLDESFQVVRRMPDEAWLANIGKFKDIVRAPTNWVFGIQSPLDRLTGQLPITEQNQQEKYVVIHTTNTLLDKQSFFAPRFSYKWGSERMPAKHAPTGRVLVELIEPKDLYKQDQEELSEKYDEVKPGERYQGNGFIVTSPQAMGYWGKDLSAFSNRKSGSPVSEFDFISVKGSGMARAFVKSYYLAPAYTDNLPETWLDVALKAAEHFHKWHFYEVELSVSSELFISGARCRRIDFSGKSTEALFLPQKGYDIICIHPDWENVNPPLIIRIGANYTFGIDEIQDWPNGELPDLPEELSNFYQKVKLIRDE